MIKTDLHVHTSYCDGKSSPEEIVLCAVSKGMSVLGFSGHSYTFFDENYCMSREGTQKYKAEISSLKEKYKGKIKILCGIEQDFYSEESTEGYDYVIGSVHYIRMPRGKKVSGCPEFGDYTYIPADESAEITRAAAEEYFGGDIYALAEKYFETEAQIIDRTGADIIGHFDLLTKFIEKDPYLDVDNLRYEAAWEKAADRLLKTGKVFEINTGAISRGYRTSPYPSLKIQDYIIEKGGKFIMSSDSHYKDTLMFKFEEFKRESYLKEI